MDDNLVKQQLKYNLISFSIGVVILFSMFAPNA